MAIKKVGNWHHRVNNVVGCVNEFCGRVRFGNDKRILGSCVDIGLKTELHLCK